MVIGPKTYWYIHEETRETIRRDWLAAVVIIGEKRYVRFWPTVADRKFWAPEQQGEETDQGVV